MKRILRIAFFFEVGLALLIVPWSSYWDRNYFAEAIPAIKAFITNNFVRGAVSGLGLLNLISALMEMGSLILRRRLERPASIAPRTLAEE